MSPRPWLEGKVPDRVDRVGVFDLRKAQTTAPAEPPAPVGSGPLGSSGSGCAPRFPGRDWEGFRVACTSELWTAGFE